MAISITICNLALGELRAPPIADIDEATTEARECSRFYQHCLDLLLERFDWSFATRIATLAQRLANDRASEWAYSYTLPADLATPKRLFPPTVLPSGLAVVPPFAVAGQPYVVEAGVLYTQVSGAILEYSSGSVSDAAMTALFKDALVYALAARLAVPLRDSRETKGELLQQAELAAQRAIADDMNRQPSRDETVDDEVAAVRSGGMGYYGGCR
jgi:hypothetical protein